MLGNISFTLFSFFYASLLTFMYFLKPRVKNAETRIYSCIVLTSFIGTITGLGTYYFMLDLEKYAVLSYLFSKLYLLFVIVYAFFMTLYILFIAFGSEKLNAKFVKRFITVLTIAFLIVSVVVLFLPIKYSTNNNIAYSFGSSVDLVYTFTRIMLICWISVLIFKYRNVKIKKCIPLFAYIVLGIIISIVQKNHPEYLLTTSMLVFVTFLMYFTIENPDVKMIEQLNIERDRADKANKAKSDFLSSMSHEIRTPLNAIVGFSQSLKEENLPPSAIEEVDDIIEASETLLDTVNGILDISKIEANKIEIVNTTYDFHKVFDELVALSKARLGEDKPIEFRYSMAPDIPKYLYGDYARLKQVVLNFLTNAIKYTKEGYIDFNVSNITKNGICRLIFKVEDSGIGIKKESINKLFDKFERLDNENSTIEGTGLGLAITKKLVELMHGKIIVQSIYGKGSQFMVILDQKIVENQESVVAENNKEDDNKISDISGKKVLIVDDNTLNLKVAARLLKQYNLNIEEVDSGFKCLDLIGAGNTYDLILMDDMMPKMSGKETFKKLKEDSTFNTPVVILTANAISGMKEQYLAEGFNDYLAKPIEKTELNRVLNKYLG